MIKNSANYVPVREPRDYGVSLAVPDLSMSIQDILTRHTNGLLPEGIIKQGGFYYPVTDNGDFSDFNGLSLDVSKLSSLDLVDRDQIIDLLKADVRSHQMVLDDYQGQHKAAIAKKQAAIDKLLQAAEAADSGKGEGGELDTAPAKGAKRSAATT